MATNMNADSLADESGIPYLDNSDEIPLHSTPKKKFNSSFCELETSTIQKQRKEIQHLMSELKDRDRELNDTISSHQQQQLEWDRDRQRLTSMGEKCCQYEADLHSKISELHQSFMTLKARDVEQKQELQERRSALDALRAENKSLQEQLSREKTSVNYYKDKLESVSVALGCLLDREKELATNVKHKEKDIAAATSQIQDLSSRLTGLDLSYKACQDSEKEALKMKEEWRRRHENSETERKTMSDELASSRAEVNRLSEKNRSARQQLSLLEKEMDMREKCKNELVDSLKMKQERTDSQLKYTRELYERKLKKVAMLEEQLDRSKEIIHRMQFSRSYQSGASSPDYDMQYYQSSGYHSQLSENQTGLVPGNQPTNVEGSPISTLEKLLYESRMMIQSLEKPSESS